MESGTSHTIKIAYNTLEGKGVVQTLVTVPLNIREKLELASYVKRFN